ncbi:MAG TPA: M64 family metallopeptidase [Planctomycetota bacterium]
MASFSMACPKCGERSEALGDAPPTGWMCPTCKVELAYAAERVVNAPRPRTNTRRAKKAEPAPPDPAARKKRLVLLAAGGGAGLLLLIVVLIVALSGNPAPTPEPAAAKSAAAPAPDPEKARRAALLAEWTKLKEDVETARRDPLAAARVLPLLEKLLDLAKGGELEAPVQKALDELRALALKPGEEKIAADVKALVDRDELRGAAQLVKAYLGEASTSPGLRRFLDGLQARVAERAPAKYEELLKEAKALSTSGKPEAARQKVLDAAGWGVAALEARARQDAAAFAPPSPAEAVDLRKVLEDRAKAELAKLEPELARMEREKKGDEAQALLAKFPVDYARTEAGEALRKRVEALKPKGVEPAVISAPEPAPERKTETAAVPGLKMLARAPRAGEYKPGGLADAEKQKKQAELAGEVKKDRKGAAKAAAAKRAEWLAGLEKEYGVYDVTTIADKGDVARRVDIVIVSSGFPKSDARKVNQMADALKAALLKVDPFQNYPDYINFHRINVDDKGTHAQARIPFRVETDILTCDYGKAAQYAKFAPSYDLVVVLCNVTKVRATGGPPFITIDADLDIGRTFLHEMGHAFASLSDEYVDAGLAPGRPFEEDENDPWLTNVTSQANPRLSKWHYWTLDLWPAAHEMNRLPAGHKVGAFEGAAYQSKGVFRPEAECLMRMGDKYCVVCFEHVEKRFYRLIAPIDDARPRKPLVGLWGDETAVFEGDAIRTMASGGASIGKFEGFWYVDGKPRSASAKNLTTALTLQGAELAAGPHEAVLRVDFSNKRVRRDEGWLSSSIGWKIDVLKHKRPKWEGPEKVQGKVGQPVTFDLKIENPDPQRFRVEVHCAPEGATYDGAKFAWTPEKVHQGGWRPRFVLTDGLRAVDRFVEIAVLDVSEKNFEPVVALMDARSVVEGELLELPLDVVDVDGDNLVFTSSNLPEGAELDVYEGVIRWKPGPRQAGKYPAVAFEVFDGRRKAKGSLDLIVEDKPRGEGLLDRLRSANGNLREKALAELGTGDWAKSFRYMEAARLLRDRDKETRAAALEALKKIEAEADAVFLGMMLRDLEPHAWHFTDQKEILRWLEALVAKAPANDADAKGLRGALKAIDKYNKDRGF